MGKQRSKPNYRRRVLRLPDLDHCKSAVLNSLGSPASRRVYEYAIDQFIAWYCSEPRLALNRIVVVRYRMHLETRGLAANTINQQLAAVRRLANEAADSGLLSPELAAGSLETELAVPSRRGLDLCQSFEARTTPLQLHRILEGAAEGRCGFWNRAPRHSCLQTHVPVMAGRGGDPDCRATETHAALRHSHHHEHLRCCGNQRNAGGRLQGSRARPTVGQLI
jgi:hypothetical protein